MSETFSDSRMATFIVRLSWPRAGGGLTGVVERVATGEKRRFYEAKKTAGGDADVVQAKRDRPPTRGATGRSSRRRWEMIRYLLLGVVVCLAFGGFGEAVAAPCGPSQSPGLYSGSMVVNGQTRTYYYRIAANYQPCEPHELLIGLHGTCGSATCGTQIDLKYVSQMYAMPPYSKRAISVYPNARVCQQEWPGCPAGQFGWDLLPS